MAFGRSLRNDPSAVSLTQGGQLSALERIATLVVIGGLVIVDVAGFFFGFGAGTLASMLSVANTAVFALYLWAPWAATCSLGVIFILSFVTGTGTGSDVILPIAIAAGLVVRLGRTPLILSYAGAFLVAVAMVAFADTAILSNVGIYLIIAAVAGATGFVLRVALDRGRRLELQLAERAEQEKEAVLAERRWIAGELHDSIAHHLTVIALHVQMLDSPEKRTESQEAIRAGAKKAMADLRFVIELADDGPRSSAVHSGDLAAAIDEARVEIESAGYPVLSEGDSHDERLPRVAEIILGRVVRESATNILKHAGPGNVSIALKIDDETAALEICSPLPATPRRDLPSSSTGLNRMAERVVGGSGEFSAGVVDGRWAVAARLPIR